MSGMHCAVILGAWALVGCSGRVETVATVADADVPRVAPGFPAVGGPGNPPAPAPDAGAPSGPDVVYAMHDIFWGDTDRSGDAGPGAWKLYGYDLDGLSGGPDVPGHCKPRPGAEPATLGDGPNGIDNSFGRNVEPILLGLESPAYPHGGSLPDPVATDLLLLRALGDGASYSGVHAATFSSGVLEINPALDGTQVWPIDYDSVIGGDIAQPRYATTASYVVDRTWVAPLDTLAPLWFSISGYSLRPVVHRAVVTMKLPVGSIDASEGIVAGVLDVDELSADLRKVAAKISSSLCDGPTLASILAQVAAAADIGKDGTQDASRTCDGISFGIGFDAVRAKLGDVLPPPTASVDPCAP